MHGPIMLVKSILASEIWIRILGLNLKTSSTIIVKNKTRQYLL